jgi:HlyD family secretion protein
MTKWGVTILVAAGLLFASVDAVLLAHAFFGFTLPTLAPSGQPVAPYPKAIYAVGVIESDQASGENVNIIPEVAGTVVATFVKEGDAVHAGQPLFALDDSVQRASTDQLRLQAEAGQAALDKLKAGPRAEAVAVEAAQLAQVRANLKTLVDQRRKLERSAALDPRSVSGDQLDQAADAVAAGKAAVDVAQRQLDLTRAGASPYDLHNQAAQQAGLVSAYQAGQAQLDKYTIRASSDGVVLVLNAPKGGFVSPFGAYDSYSEANRPAAVLGPGAPALAVRSYVDGAALGRLPHKGRLAATMLVRGLDLKIPLEFVRIQPYVNSNQLLSDASKDHAGLRALPVIFRFRPDPQVKLYPGQLVDVYIRQD